MSAHDETGDDLEVRQERGLAALLTCRSIAKAAEKAGVHEGTLRRWLREDAAFRRRYRGERRQIVEHAVTMLQRLTTRAVRTLARNLKAGKPSDQNKAAMAILTHAYRGVEVLDLMTEIEELQAKLESISVSGDPAPEGGQPADGGGGEVPPAAPAPGP
jgi:hypothetical protein